MNFLPPERWVGLFSARVQPVLWFFWHTPFFSYRHELGLGGLIGFFLGLLAGAVCLTCPYNSTGGSVLMCVLWHTTFNMVNLPRRRFPNRFNHHERPGGVGGNGRSPQARYPPDCPKDGEVRRGYALRSGSVIHHPRS